MQNGEGRDRPAPDEVGQGQGAAADGGSAVGATDDAASGPGARPRRPMLERLGLAFIAIVMASLFAAIALAAWGGGELFLAAAGAVGCLMTLWVGTLTLFRS